MIEYAGSAIRGLSMEGRMTVCNMTIEGGARAGMIAPDEKAFEYLKGRPMAPKGEAWDKAVAYWNTLKTDEGAHFDRVAGNRGGAAHHGHGGEHRAGDAFLPPCSRSACRRGDNGLQRLQQRASRNL